MRLLPLTTATTLLAAAFVALPVTAVPAAQPVPVAPVVDAVPISVALPAGQQQRTRGLEAGALPASTVVEHESADPFSVIGFRWDAGTGAAPQLEVSVREDGGWSSWQALAALDEGPDAGTAEAALAAGHVTTEPFLSAEADAFQVRVTPTGGALPTGLEAVTVDPGTSPADASLAGNVPVATADAAAGNAPAIITRAQWGADESLRTSKPECVTPSYSSTLKVGIVHHTASTNSYDAAGAAAQVRGIYAYHVQGNGWCDVGYNFIVDKFGRVFEGRWGGVDRPVVGAHAGGFNRDTFGVSALGEYGAVGASDAMTDAIGRVLGWKLGLHNRNPLGQDVLVSAGGGTSRYPAGQAVTLNTVSGHRDVGSTSCPGQNLYNRLGTIRSIAYSTALQTDTVVTGGTPAAATVAYGGAPVAISAVLPAAQWFTVDVVETCTGRTVYHGEAYSERGRVNASWNLRDPSGQAARGGRYAWYVRTPAGGSASGTIDVTPPRETAETTGWSGGVSQAGYVPIAPTRIHDSRDGRTQPLGPGSSRSIWVQGPHAGTPSSGVAAVALNVTAVCAGAPSFFTAWPTGSAEPSTSSLNTGAGDTVPGMVVVPVGRDGSVNIANDAGSAHLLVDVVGYFPAAGGSTLRTTAPTRVLDPATSGRMSNAETRVVDVAGQLGLPRGTTTGAVVNVTISDASAPGNVSAFPAGAAAPVASTANVIMGRDTTNRTMVALTDGRLAVRNVGGSARVYVDVVGYFTSAGGGSRYTSVAPSRVLDTRYGPGQRAALGGGETTRVRTAGAGSVPADATAVLATLTSDGTSEPTHLRAWASGTPRPVSSELNPWPGVAAANAALLPVGASGSTDVFNNSGSTHVIVDVVGYFR